jgi:hypothetical protein
MALQLIMHKFSLCTRDLIVDVIGFLSSFFFFFYIDGLGCLACSHSELINFEIMNLTDSW